MQHRPRAVGVGGEEFVPPMGVVEVRDEHPGQGEADPGDVGTCRKRQKPKQSMTQLINPRVHLVPANLNGLGLPQHVPNSWDGRNP